MKLAYIITSIIAISLSSCETLSKFSRSPEGQRLILESINEGTETVIDRINATEGKK